MAFKVEEKLSQDHPKILFVTEALGEEAFGVSQVVFDLLNCCEQYQLPYKVLVSRCGSIPVRYHPHVARIPTYKLGQRVSTIGRITRWHHRMGHFFRQQIESFSPDVIHVHGVFTFVQKSVVEAATKSGVPFWLAFMGWLIPGYGGNMGMVISG